MNSRKPHLPSFCLTLGLSALLAGFGLSHSLHTAHAAKPVMLPDLPDAKGTGTRLPNGWHITPVGTPIALPGDLPLKMLFSPDGKYLLVNTGGYHNHNVDVIDPATNKLVQSIDVDKNWAGLCFDPAGRTVYVAGGEGTTAYYVAEAVKDKQSARRVASLQETILRLGYADGRLTLQPALPVPSLAGTEHFSAGLAAGQDGALYMAEIEGDRVYKFKGDPAVLQASFKARYHPCRW